MTTMHSHSKRAVATVNRRILATGAGLLALVLPMLWNGAGGKPAIFVFAFEAALCLALFLLKGSRRAAIRQTWECSTQAVLIRQAFVEELREETPQPVEEPLAVFLK